jgi:two-component system OmpR family response regulator
MSAPRVLIVDDEPDMLENCSRILSRSGYACTTAGDGTAALAILERERPDLLLTDFKMPGMDGLTLLRRWREAGITTPVLVLTARGTWHEKVVGIDTGADDYVTKPFEMEEVLARVRGLIRRANRQPSPELRCAAIVLDPRTARVTVAGAPVRLTSHEFRVLSYLMHHRDRVVSQSELAEHIYPRDADRDSNTVEVFVARLRKKIGAASIETVRGLGYRMDGA